MLKNYILIAWRNFVKHGTFSIINITGFALAMASCFLIIFHIRSEISYETFYPDYKNIYRLHVPEWAKSSAPMAQASKDFFPEIESIGRFFNWGSGSIVAYNDYQTIIGNSFMADSTVLDMFDYEFIQGSPKTSLRTPFTAVITESLANRVFGKDEAVGKILKLNGEADLTISGVIKDIPENTHIRFEMLVAYTTFYKLIPENWTSNKGWMAPFTYAHIPEGQFANLLSKMPDFQVKFYEGFDTPEKLRELKLLEWQPLKDIHLHSNLEQEMGENSNASYLYIFAAVAAFILLIASVNFINLNVSLAFRRMKETGLRKVMGAIRAQLIKQYLAETLVMSFLALVLALVLFFAVVPNYNELSGRDIQTSDVLTIPNMLIMVGLIIGVSLLSGAYPALFMSRFKPTDALKSQRGPGSSTPIIRKALVVFQFAVSAFMIASTVIIVRQMNYFQNQELGFNKDKVISVNLYGDFKTKLGQNPDAVKSELMKEPSILSIGLTTNMPGDQVSVEGVVPEGADPNKQYPSFRVMAIDDAFLQTLEIPVLQGRGFSRTFNDSASFIVNKAALDALEITGNPIGMRIFNQTRNVAGPIVGVVDDYHFTSLHNAVDPLVLQYEPKYTNYLLLKTSSNDLQKTIKQIENTVKSISPSNLFSYSFLEDRWNAQYKEENKMNALFNTFSVFMIVISCIGLFGLSAITLQTRRKEIGIRKVVGASVPAIVGIMSREFVILVVVGSLVGLPLSWYAMNNWLSGFAYKINITADVFLISVVCCVLIAFGSVLFNALRAANTNPVESLRSE